MNEQLIVKNFGPIKDATVDFKRVTVFIGPTGGGKSTLAKLAAIFREKELFQMDKLLFLKKYSLDKYPRNEFKATWKSRESTVELTEAGAKLDEHTTKTIQNKTRELVNDTMLKLSSVDNNSLLEKIKASSKVKNTLIDSVETFKDTLLNSILINLMEEVLIPNASNYIPSERNFVAAVEYSWAGFLRDDIGLPKPILDFSNGFSTSRKDVLELDIPFLNAKYIHINGQDFIKVPGVETLFRLYETASGIQSVTPLLVLLEHLSRNTEQAQSFIIEEPELNLYPTAQQGLLNWLVEKCTKGENDLTITTHSPYILSHLNLLLYAYHVGTKDEEKRQKVAAIIPEQYWLNPDEFAAYYVNGPEGAGGVRSLLDPETKLISQNELDAVSGVQADEFDQLLDINRGF